MKNILYIVLLISQTFWAQDDFSKANQLYQKKNYQEAITTYETILASGKQSAELYFNIGNCYYKLHKVAPAIYNYEKALQLHPNDVQIQTNLSFARKMTVDDDKFVPKVGFHKLIEDFTSSFKYDTWAWIAVLFSFAFLGFFIGYYFSKAASQKRLYFTGMFLVLIGIMVSFFSGIYERNRISSDKTAIVFAESTSVKMVPKSSAKEAIVLHEGSKVSILDSIANWKKVQLPDETTGWIDEEAIKELN